MESYKEKIKRKVSEAVIRHKIAQDENRAMVTVIIIVIAGILFMAVTLNELLNK